MGYALTILSIICYVSFKIFFLPVDLPKISQHPESKSVATGASTTFTIEATGDDLHFQWKKDSEKLLDGRKCRDTKTHTLRIKDVEKNDKGSYQCLVKNGVGEKLSEEADLAVSKLVMKFEFPCFSLPPPSSPTLQKKKKNVTTNFLSVILPFSS